SSQRARKVRWREAGPLYGRLGPSQSVTGGRSTTSHCHQASNRAAVVAKSGLKPKGLIMAGPFQREVSRSCTVDAGSDPQPAYLALDWIICNFLPVPVESLRPAKGAGTVSTLRTRKIAAGKQNRCNTKLPSVG